MVGLLILAALILLAIFLRTRVSAVRHWLDRIARVIAKCPWWALCLGILFLFAAIIALTSSPFWASHNSRSWQECIYGDPVCSTAAATWALGAFGILTFGAAYRAVYWAKRAYNVEVVPALGQSICARHADNDHPNDKAIFLIPGEGRFIAQEPLLDEGKTIDDVFYSHPNAFENLGRSALSDVVVKMHIRDANGKTLNPENVFVGNVKCEREVHLVVYISKTFKPVTIMWSAATSKGRPIDFFPESGFAENIIYPINVNEGMMPLPLEDIVADRPKA